MSIQSVLLVGSDFRIEQKCRAATADINLLIIYYTRSKLIRRVKLKRRNVNFVAQTEYRPDAVLVSLMVSDGC